MEANEVQAGLQYLLIIQNCRHFIPNPVFTGDYTIAQEQCWCNFVIPK
jgi:hypothetical protein